MSRTPKRDPEAWQRLLKSTDTYRDLCEIYPAAFFEGFVTHFDRGPEAVKLFKGVIDTGHAYVRGKWLKKAEKSKFLQYSGVHMMGAGDAARQLAKSLQQLSKSDLANQMVSSRLAKVLAADASTGQAQKAYFSPASSSGPQSRLDVVHQLALALEEAIDQIITLPLEDDDAAETRQRALTYVEEANRTKVKTLSKNFALEEAARAFQPLWEEFSTVAYIRGRYKHEIGGYDCDPGRALHQIIKELDSTVAESLAGTAIENIRVHL
jgi:hypothetical protein